MKRKDPAQLSNLQQKAEEQLKKMPLTSKLSEDELQKLIYQNELYKIELEMQKEELMLTKNLASQNDALKKLNRFALELSNLSSEDNLEIFITRQIKEFAGAKLATFSEYNPLTRTLTTKQTKTEYGLLEKVDDLLGTGISNVRAFVSEEMYKEITSEMVGVRRSLHEVSFGAIPRPVGAAIEALLKVDRVIGVVYLIEGKLFGTSVLAMEKGKPDPSKELLQTFAHLAATSLRRNLSDLALKESEKKYQFIADNIGDVVTKFNLKTFECNYVSPSILNNFGYTVEEFYSKTMLDIFTQDSVQLMKHNLRKRLDQFEKGDYSLTTNISEYQMLHKNKSVLWVESTTSILKDESGLPNEVIVVSRNIETRKKAEQALKENQNFVNNILNSATDAIYVKDLQGKYVFLNAAAEKTVGKKAQEIIGKNDFHIFPKNEADAIISSDCKVLEGDIPITFEEYLTTANGIKATYLSTKGPFFDTNGKKVGLFGFARNITDRKNIEQALIESEQRFSLFMNHLPALVFIKDSETRVIYANNSIDIALGASKWLGLKASEIFDDETAERIKYDDEKTFQTGYQKVEESFHTLDGEIHQYETQKFVIPRSGQKPLLGGIAIDVTERKKVEKTLLDIIDKNPMSIQILNPEGFTLQVNEAFVKLFGSVPPSSYSIFNDNQLREKEFGKIIDNLKNGKVVQFPDTLFNPYDSVPAMSDIKVWIRAIGFPLMSNNGKLEKFVFMHEDISERKKIEQELKESEEKYSQLIENAQEGVWIIDCNSYTVYVNQKMVEIFGYSKEEMEGKQLFDFMDSKGKEHASFYLDRRKLGMNENHFFEFITKAGRRIYTNVSTNPLFDKNGKYNGEMALVTDFTVQKQFEQSLIENEKHLIQINADKDKFFSIIAHDLRSPFNILIGYTQMMAEDLDSMSIKKIQTTAELVNKAATSLFNLLDNLLKWTSMKQGLIPFKPQKIILADILNKALDVLLPAAEVKNIKIHNNIDTELTAVADTSMLITVIRNLVSNAIKFTNSAGEIKINAGQTSPFVTISVSDNGVGISPEDSIKLFEVSDVHTTIGTAGEKGTGLGLILCREFVEKHQGRIWVESEKDKGSTFYFTLNCGAS